MDLRDIRRAYRRSNEEGNEAFDLLLVDILGIKNPPKISVEKRDPGKTANGEYKSSINTIVIYKRDTPIRDCRGAGVLAHEMWHAYQEMQASYRNGTNTITSIISSQKMTILATEPSSLKVKRSISVMRLWVCYVVNRRTIFREPPDGANLFRR